ncbi:MAG TPA: hypothetical protein VHW02_10540 [Rhizomicrobium sp.]|jgi:hypothetical protein|nr:hypothetical protein [Rhizomicrobium sp.]
MAKIYAPNKSNIKPVTVTDDVYMAIGKFVRAFAEIEDLIKLHICDLAQMRESEATVLLCRTALSQKLVIAKYIGKMKNPNIAILHDHIFGERFSDFKLMRNTLAHGVLLGQTEEGALAFLTDQTLEPTKDSALQEVVSLMPSDIVKCSVTALKMVHAMEKALKLESWRSTRRGRPLDGHRKAQPKARQPQKPSPLRR